MVSDEKHMQMCFLQATILFFYIDVVYFLGMKDNAISQNVLKK
ncbi:hypothetical protein SSCHL_0554 [Staphylococcus schleiferi]|nr:hypothetical protein SSCHL_0554 [Staphylococcus schleiferi]